MRAASRSTRVRRTAPGSSPIRRRRSTRRRALRSRSVPISQLRPGAPCGSSGGQLRRGRADAERAGRHRAHRLAAPAGGRDESRPARAHHVDQRLNTTGGVAPAGTCTPGATTAVPYSADYFFWRDHPASPLPAPRPSRRRAPRRQRAAEIVSTRRARGERTEPAPAKGAASYVAQCDRLAGSEAGCGCFLFHASAEVASATGVVCGCATETYGMGTTPWRRKYDPAVRGQWSRALLSASSSSHSGVRAYGSLGQPRARFVERLTTAGG